MRMILSPAKKMNVDLDSVEYVTMPKFLRQTEEILDWLKSKSYGELKKIWNCNDKIAIQNLHLLPLIQFVKVNKSDFCGHIFLIRNLRYFLLTNLSNGLIMQKETQEFIAQSLE